MNNPILKISTQMNLQKNIDVTADGDLELLIQLLKTDGVSININAKTDGNFLILKVESNDIGNGNNSAMAFYHSISDYLMKNVGTLYFNSSLNFATTSVEIHLDNEEFITQVIEKIKYIFSLHQYDIEKEQIGNHKKMASLKLA